MEHACGRRTSFICFIALCVVTEQTAGDWTDWYSRPIDIETNNDIETADAIKTVHPALMCDNPTSIEATTVNGIAAQQTGDVFRQFNAFGLVCMDEDQDNRTCHDYKVRFCCPGSHGTMTCATDDMLRRYPVEAFAHVNVTEDIYLGVPIFNLSDFIKDGFFKQFLLVEIVSGNKYNRFGVSEDNRQIIVTAFLSASITPTFNLTIHMKRKNGTREAYGLHIQVVDIDHWPPFYNKTCESPERPIIQHWPWFYDYKVTDDWASKLEKTPPERQWASIYINIDTNNSECYITVGAPFELKSFNYFNWTDFVSQLRVEWCVPAAACCACGGGRLGGGVAVLRAPRRVWGPISLTVGLNYVLDQHRWPPVHLGVRACRPLCVGATFCPFLGAISVFSGVVAHFRSAAVGGVGPAAL